MSALNMATILVMVTAQVHLIVADVLLIRVASETDLDDAVALDHDNRWYASHSNEHTSV